MRLFRRRNPKPKWSHPCPLCNRAGREYPHGGQHTVMGPPPSMQALPPPPVPHMEIRYITVGDSDEFLRWLRANIRRRP